MVNSGEGNIKIFWLMPKTEVLGHGENPASALSLSLSSCLTQFMSPIVIL